MADRIQIGEVSLEYLDEIEKILNVLTEGLFAAERARKRVFEGNIYEGRAKAEIEIFYENYFKKICNLYSLYTRCSEYVTYVIKEIKYTDEEMTKLILGAMRG